MLKKNLFKTAVLVLISVLMIWIMSKNNVLDFQLLSKSFYQHPTEMAMVFVIQGLNFFFMALRYHHLLKVFSIRVGFFNNIAATMVSNSIGLWLPGSMAFIEIIRIGLMLGADRHKNAAAKTDLVQQTQQELSLRSKLTAVSVFDRLIGLFVMLFCGTIATAFVLCSESMKAHLNTLQITALWCLFVFSFACSMLIIILPKMAQWLPFRKGFSHIERITLATCYEKFGYGFLKKVFHEINALLDAIAIGSRHLHHFFVPVFFSFICFTLISLGTYVSALALSDAIALIPIFATVSILSLASLLPIGFAGIGGIQLVAAFALSVFGVSAKSAASAQFFQNAINLLAVSFLGLFFLKLTINQVKVILKTKKS